MKSSAGFANQLNPSASPAHSGRTVIVNAAGTGYAFSAFPHFEDNIPVLSRLPSHPTDRRHRFAIIPSLYHIGTPEAFTLTAGFDDPICGYNRLEGDNLGSISFNHDAIQVPFDRLIGLGASSSDWGIDDSASRSGTRPPLKSSPRSRSLAEPSIYYRHSSRMVGPDVSRTGRGSAAATQQLSTCYGPTAPPSIPW